MCLKAHMTWGEHKIISALESSSVPHQKQYGLCSDPEVNGASFYVMDFIDGVVLNDSTVGVAIEDSDRPALGEHVINILCDLHAVDIDAVGLGDLGRKEAYLARQLNRWSKQWVASKTHEIPAMEACQSRCPSVCRIKSGLALSTATSGSEYDCRWSSCARYFGLGALHIG